MFGRGALMFHGTSAAAAALIAQGVSCCFVREWYGSMHVNFEA